MAETTTTNGRTKPMKLSARCLVSAAAVAAMLAAATGARAETWTLELKRLESPGRYARPDYVYRATMPQSFFVQMGPQGKNYANQSQAAAFKRLVHKEPKYQSACPFRGVAKLGSQEFAFALDSVSPPPKDGKPDAKKTATERQKPNADSAVAKLADRLLKATTPADTPSPSAISYNRLYFDFNRNGDLTDDKVIEAEMESGPRAMSVRGQSYSQFQFPRIDVTIDAEGTKLDYSFFLTGRGMVSPDYSYASVSLSAAAYRQGDITLEGKKHRVVLIDFNSNGRFDDQIRIRKDVRTLDGRLYPEQGDMLLVDPDPSNPGLDSPYDVTSGKSRHYVSKLVNIDGRYYDMQVTPAGDRLTLTPSPAALGSVTNPNDGYRAVIYGDQGFLKISGNKGTSTPVPEGEWKLLSYTISPTAPAEPIKPAEKKPAGKNAVSQKGSLLQGLAKSLESLLGGSTPPGSRSGYTIVAAQATAAYKAVEVRSGETVELPFGPPYKPVVTADFFEDGNQGKLLSLGMSLVGSTGEVCTNLTVNGRQPGKPEFTITDPKGKIVEQGSFEYG